MPVVLSFRGIQVSAQAIDYCGALRTGGEVAPVASSHSITQTHSFIIMSEKAPAAQERKIDRTDEYQESREGTFTAVLKVEDEKLYIIKEVRRNRLFFLPSSSEAL